MEFKRRATLVSVAAAVYTLVFTLWMLFTIGGENATQQFSDIAGIVPGLVAAIASAAAARRTSGGYRRAWAFIAVGSVASATGEAIWAFYELVLRIDAPLPSWADVAYLCALPFMAIGLLCFPAAPVAAASRLRTLADAALLGISAFYISWVLGLRALFAAGTETGLGKAVSLAYPIADVVLFATLILVAARTPRAGRGPFALLALALTANGAADVLYAFSSASEDYQAGTVLDSLWVAAMLFVAVAASTQPADAVVETAVAREGAPWRRKFMPYILLAPAAGVAVLQALGHRRIDSGSVALGMVLVVLVVVRQLLMLIENAALTQRLQLTVDTLESRESDMHHQAMHDPLTGLANRALFRDRLEHAVNRSRRDLEGIAVLFLDLDDFKVVNDGLGHETGDELLVAVAARLQRAVRAVDTVARLGGDEFAVLISQGGCEGARLTAARISEQLQAPFHLFEHEIDLRASIGVALAEPADADAEDLLRNADLAMYSAKYAGKGRSAFYAPQMRADLLDELELKSELQRAVAEDQLRLVYQPIVDLHTGAIVGVEALARWDHPRLGLLEPGIFIPIAEQSGLIVPLGRAVLREACRQLKSWQELYGAGHPLTMSVNLSARQLADRHLVEDVTCALAEFNVVPGTLTLEITESVLMTDIATTMSRLAELKALGVRLAIDDFGTGYSSLAYLGRFPIDALKIDRSFVMGLDDSLQRSLTTTIIGLGRLLGVAIIAEGIETARQFAVLSELGCSHGQGYYFGRPVTPSGISESLAARTKPGSPAQIALSPAS